MRRLPFDHDWRFKLDERLPHDWSIALDRKADNPSRASHSYLTMGRTACAKAFTAPQDWCRQRVFTQFEGVYMNAECWLNSHLLGRHPHGYTCFTLDLTPHLKFGGENILAVNVDNSCQLNSRWYSGSGIYRHVWLWTGGPVRVAHSGIYVTTETGVLLRSRLVAPDGRQAGGVETAASIGAAGREAMAQEAQVTCPRLWSPETPRTKGG